MPTSKNKQADMENNILTAVNLNKSFNDNHAVSNFSINVKQGEILGVIGPDGAGKTTLLRMLSTVMKPDNGTLNIDDVDAIKNYKNSRSKIGYMSQKFGLYTDMSVIENIEFFGEIQGVHKTTIHSRAEKLLKASGMIKFKDRLASKLSGGMKQKLSLSCSLIHEPKLLILDEPTNGVDPVSRREFWQILNKFSSDGIAIVYATSYLEEAERCNNIVLMNKGKTIINMRSSEIKTMSAFNVIEVKGELARTLIKKIPDKFGKVWSFGSKIHIHTKDKNNALNELKSLFDDKITISHIEPTLEDIFTYLTTDEVNSL